MPAESHPSDRNPSASSVAAWLALLLAVACGLLIWRQAMGPLTQPSPLHNPDAKPRPVMARGDLAQDEQATIELYRAAAPSVVHVTSFSGRSQLLDQSKLGSGSGFLWDTEGHVVTNYHVIQNANAARVTLFDGSVHDARLVGSDPDHDVAVLKIDAPQSLLVPIPIGTSADLVVGQKAFAIGNPYGLDQTLTTGIISGLGREIQSVTQRTIFDVIQTDAAINPGNSGGPLLDSAGRLIGINTAIYSPSGANAGIGFAVPVDTVNRAVPQIIRTGEVERPGMGVAIWGDTFTAELRQQGIISHQGVLIREVLDNGAAAEAGLIPTLLLPGPRVRVGDIIVAIGGQRIESTTDLFRVFEQHRVGDEVAITVIRDDQEVEIDLVLKPLPSFQQ